MSPERSQQVRELFDLTLALNPSGLQSFLAVACGSDTELCAEVESMVAKAREAAASVDRSAAGADCGILPGTEIAGYRIVAKIGEGGVAQVFEAVRTIEGTALERIALKVFRLGPQDGGGVQVDLRRRFLRETRLTKELRHPHIARVLEVIDVPGLSAIVMELIDGQPLSAIIPGGGMPIPIAVRAGIEVCGALGSAHARGIIHRDLKPANVMIDKSGSVKVLDFGAAKQLVRASQTGADNTSTAQGMVIGTPAYMSPEQVRGERVGPSTDVFSFGSLMYEMLTGISPFKRKSMLATMSAILREPVRPLRGMRAEISTELAEVVNWCLAKDPTERFGSIVEAGMALEAATTWIR